MGVINLYCTVLYCTVLYCTVLYCTVLLKSVVVPRMAVKSISHNPERESEAAVQSTPGQLSCCGAARTRKLYCVCAAWFPEHTRSALLLRRSSCSESVSVSFFPTKQTNCTACAPLWCELRPART